MTDREKLMAEINSLLQRAPDPCLRCVLHFLLGWLT